jgi:uncharacterized membrane protein
MNNTLLALSSWVHLIGVTIWVGASLLLPTLIMPALGTLEPPARSKFMAAWSSRATPVINIAIVLVVLSGLAQIWLRYGTWNVLGFNVLTAKLFMVVLMMANGIYLGVILSKKISQLAPAPATPPSPEFLKAQKSMDRHAWIQAGMAVITLLLVGFLTA